MAEAVVCWSGSSDRWRFRWSMALSLPSRLVLLPAAPGCHSSTTHRHFSTFTFFPFPTRHFISAIWRPSSSTSPAKTTKSFAKTCFSTPVHLSPLSPAPPQNLMRAQPLVGGAGPVLVMLVSIASRAVASSAARLSFQFAVQLRRAALLLYPQAQLC